METKELPQDVKLPETSILTKQDYEHIYHLISQKSEFEKLAEVYNSEQPIDDVFAETEYDSLINAGLISRQTGAGDPYVRITSLGEIIVENGVDDGIRELIQGEYKAQEEYSSD